MRVDQFLKLEGIIPDLFVSSKDKAVHELIHAMAELGYLCDETQAETDIASREQKLTTGIGRGIAVPHARTTATDRLRVVFGRHKEGIDWGALDGAPVHFIVLMVSPPDAPGPHLQFLAEMVRLLNAEDIQEKLLNASTARGILRILTPKKSIRR